MGGYVFFGENGQRLWHLNLGGAIVWYGLLEELFESRLKEATLEEHNFGICLDATAYQGLAEEVIHLLQSDQPLPKATDEYRMRNQEELASFKENALNLFRDSLKNLPARGMFFAVDDLETDWLEEPCRCDTCKPTNRWEQALRWYSQG